VAENRARVAAFVWLVSSILPFLFILWHPQWTMFFAAPIVLTSMIHRDLKKFMLLDLVGMFLFVATTALTFVDNVDAAMFQGKSMGLDFNNSYWMADLFDWFGVHSLHVFYSGFCAYLVLQIALKWKPLVQGPLCVRTDPMDYGSIRYRFYVGLLMFLVPASVSIYEDLTGNMVLVHNFVGGRDYGALFGPRTFEQSFVAAGRAIKQVSVFLQTSPGMTANDVLLEIIDVSGGQVAKTTESTDGTNGSSWHAFNFDSVQVSEGGHYKIRLTSPASGGGSGTTWWASVGDSYKGGEAIVDGVPMDSDFAFRIGFVK
jgi:hypothetical protein